MTISAISSFSASQTSSYQTYRQAFSQLTNALQSGNLSAAQDAYSTLASSPAAQGNGPFAQALQQIGQDLQSGDLKDAQQALASLQQQQQARGHHHHHGAAAFPARRIPRKRRTAQMRATLTTMTIPTASVSTSRSPRLSIQAARSTSRLDRERSAALIVDARPSRLMNAVITFVAFCSLTISLLEMKE